MEARALVLAIVGSVVVAGCAAPLTETAGGLPMLGAIDEKPTRDADIAPRPAATRLDCGGLSSVPEARVDVLAGRLSAPMLASPGDLITAMSALGPLSIGNPSEQQVVVGRAGDGHIALVVRETFRTDPRARRLSIDRPDGSPLETGPTRAAISKLTDREFGSSDVEELIASDAALRIFVARPAPRYAHRGNAFVPLAGVVIAKDGTLLVVEMHVGAGLPLDRCADYGEALLASFASGERALAAKPGRLPLGIANLCIDSPGDLAVIDGGGVDGMKMSLHWLVPAGLGSAELRLRSVDLREPDPEGPRTVESQLFGIPVRFRGDWSSREGTLAAVATTETEMVAVELVAEGHAGWLTKLRGLAESIARCP